MSTEHVVAGGDFLTTPVKRNDAYTATKLLPEFLLTPSGYLADVALEFWWSEENVAEARAFGVLEGLLPDAVASIAVHRRGRCRCHHDCDGARTP